MESDKRLALYVKALLNVFDTAEKDVGSTFERVGKQHYKPIPNDEGYDVVDIRDRADFLYTMWRSRMMRDFANSLSIYITEINKSYTYEEFVNYTNMLFYRAWVKFMNNIHEAFEAIEQAARGTTPEVEAFFEAYECFKKWFEDFQGELVAMEENIGYVPRAFRIDVC